MPGSTQEQPLATDMEGAACWSMGCCLLFVLTGAEPCPAFIKRAGKLNCPPVAVLRAVWLALKDRPSATGKTLLQAGYQDRYPDIILTHPAGSEQMKQLLEGLLHPVPSKRTRVREYLEQPIF